jgi:hypothetical protein
MYVYWTGLFKCCRPPRDEPIPFGKNARLGGREVQGGCRSLEGEAHLPYRALLITFLGVAGVSMLRKVMRSVRWGLLGAG